MSLPSRERGLKLYDGTIESAGGYVAPFAGAWIEINVGIADKPICNGRSLRGSVD